MDTRLSYFYHYIDSTNTVNEKPIFYLIEQNNFELNETNNFGYIALISCTNVIVKNSDVEGILLANTTHSTIFNMSSHNSRNGIYLFASSNNEIINCSAYNNSWQGIIISSWHHIEYSSSNNNFTNCDVYNNRYGIYLSFKRLPGQQQKLHSGSSNNNFINCNVYSNLWGIYFFGTSINNSIINCDIYDSSLEGICFSSFSSSPSSSNIINCNVYNNGGYGIELLSSIDNNIIGCNSYNNTNAGIFLSYSSNNYIANCSTYNNTEYGFHFYGSSDCKLENNTIYDNGYNFAVAGSIIDHFHHDIAPSNTVNGKPIWYLSKINNFELNDTHNIGYLALVSCTNITVKNADVNGVFVINTTDSTISNVDSHSSRYGIHLWMSSDNNITNCNVYNNKNQGIYLTGSSNNNIINCSSHDNSQYGIYLTSGSSDNNIINCSVYNHERDRGIYLNDYSNRNNILNCTVYNSKYSGIWLRYSSDNTITNCTVYDNQYGIKLWFFSNRNTITNCNAYNNDYGIHFAYSSNSKLRGNTIHDNTVYDFVVDDHVDINYFYHDIDTSNTVNGKPIRYLVDEENTILDGTDNFGYLALISCTNVTAKNSDVTGTLLVMGTTDSTIYNVNSHDSRNGIYLYQSSNNEIIDCDVYNNTLNGINFREAANNNNITNCNAYNNSLYGIFLRESSNNNIVNCDVYDNKYYGIWIYYSSNSNTITNCDVYNNSDTGIFISRSLNSKLRGNAIYDNVYNFGVETNEWDPDIIHFTHDIDTSNTVNEKPIRYLIDQENDTLDGTIDDFGYLGLISCTNITAKNADANGILMAGTTDSTIFNISTHNSAYGIYLWMSSDNNVTNCNAYNNKYGIYIVLSSNGNLICHNNFVDNVENASDECSNQWDDESMGNYWGNYDGVDDDHDGIGDTPYNIPGGNNQDRYPLMAPWGDDVASPVITDVILTSSDPVDTDAPYGWENITCTVIDSYAVFTAKLVVANPDTTTVEYPMTKIQGTDTYYCNTTFTDAGYYDYHIWADDISGNNATSPPKQFALPTNEDVDMNGKAHFSDLMDVIRKYADTGPGYPLPSSFGWIREDVDNNGKAHFSDLMDIIRHYGEWWT